MSLTKLRTVSTKRTLIISRMIDKFDTKSLEINVEYKIAKKTSYYSIHLLLAFQKELIICNDSNYALNSVYYKNINYRISVNYRIEVKTNYYSIDSFLVFWKYLIVSNDSNYALNSVY